MKETGTRPQTITNALTKHGLYVQLLRVYRPIYVLRNVCAGIVIRKKNFLIWPTLENILLPFSSLSFRPFIFHMKLTVAILILITRSSIRGSSSHLSVQYMPTYGTSKWIGGCLTAMQETIVSLEKKLFIQTWCVFYM